MTYRCLAILLVGLAVTWAGAEDLAAQTKAPVQHPHMRDHKMTTPQGMDAHHSFNDAETWARQFDDPGRDAWQKPGLVLDTLGLQRTDKVADIGAGTGYFSVRIAGRVPDGKVFAVDVEPAMVRYLQARAHRDHLRGLVAVQATTDSPALPEPVDVALLVDTYHHIQDPVAYFARLKRSLRPGGRVAIIDLKLDAPDGPARRFRKPPERVTAEMQAAGYSLVTSHSILPRQYFLVFRPGMP